jgi:hypothetical protein
VTGISANAANRSGLSELVKTIDPEAWAKSGATLRIGEAPTQVDVLLHLSGVDFRQVETGAVDGRYGAVPVRFIGLDDLIVNKRAAGRPKDLADVAALAQRQP